MGILKDRVGLLENAWTNVGLQALSDAELSAHIATLPFKSSQLSRAIIAFVLRHPSAFPVVKHGPST